MNINTNIIIKKVNLENLKSSTASLENEVKKLKEENQQVNFHFFCHSITLHFFKLLHVLSSKRFKKILTNLCNNIIYNLANSSYISI